MRQRLLALVRARVEGFGVDHDPATVLDPEALAELAALLETVPDPAADLEITNAAGWLRWWRYRALDPGGNQQELADALALFVPVYQVRPDAVPHQVRTYFGRLAANDPQVVADRAASLLEETLSTGNPADLDAVIDASRQVVAATLTGHPGHAKSLSTLGFALATRFSWTGNQADLDAAIDACLQAVAVTPGHAGYRSNLSVALIVRFERTGDRADLDAAIDASQKAVAATPIGHPDRAAMLSTLGYALTTRFGQNGDQADLDAAIDASQKAVAATPIGHPGLAGYLTMLGAALRIRFDRTGDGASLDAAIDASQKAVAATPIGHPDRAATLSALGAALQARYERTGDRSALDDAIDADRHAVAASSINRPAYLSNLGLALRIRFERSGDGTDLDDAIDASQQAVAASSTGHPGRAAMLSALGLALQARYERTGDRTDLDDAIDADRQAVAASSTDYPGRAGYLSNLGLALQARYERTGDRTDLDDAIDAGQQAVAVEGASPRVRAIAARGWGRAAAGGRRWQEAVAGFAAAAELLGLVAPRSLARGDQERLLEQFGGLGADAAACCVHAGLTDRAVELFEQGRGVLLGQALDTRTGLTALTEQRPDLAARFIVLRDDLDRDDDPAGSAPALPTGMGGTATDGRPQAARRDMERRRAAATAFDQVIAEIRRLKDFRGFLRPPLAAELLAATAEGPVVVVTVSRFGSYALILTGGGVLDPVPLTGLTPETVYDRVTAFLGALEDAGSPAAEQRLGDTLGWLWDTLAGPVLDRLGITGPPPAGDPPPRLWWCLPGLLSFLPVHAAGHHQTGDDAAPATVVDRVISSYTPTIRALTYARRSPSTIADDRSGRPGTGDRVIAVAMPHTPGESDLPGAQAEVTALQQCFPSRVTVLTGEQATHDTVLRALQAGRWAHFACHGASDLSNPSASYLLLTDHRQRPLTVVDVARLRLDAADLAFLSACSTGRPGGRLADEAIHLASAFQLAGYRHVIATLWPIGDQHAVDIADRIYTTLTTTGEDDVAGAVHAAVLRMRRRWGWDAPSVWASHIHAGA